MTDAVGLSWSLIWVTILGFVLSIALSVYYLYLPFIRTENKADELLLTAQGTLNNIDSHANQAQVELDTFTEILCKLDPTLPICNS